MFTLITFDEKCFVYSGKTTTVEVKVTVDIDEDLTTVTFMKIMISTIL